MLVELQKGMKKVGFQMDLKYNWNFHSALTVPQGNRRMIKTWKECPRHVE